MKQWKLENTPIVYYISGTEHKQWVVFLHAAFVDHNMFRQQIAYFQDKYNVLTLDIIGHGQSTDTKKGDSIEKMPVWIHEILKKEQIDRAHIVGISLGAILAQKFADQFPQAVQSLACFGGYDIRHFQGEMQQKNQAAHGLMVLKAVFSIKWFAESNKKISAYTHQAQKEFFEMNLRFPRRSFRYFAARDTGGNAPQTGPRGYPLLIGCGQHDFPAELSTIEAWKEREPECQVRIFPGAGHCVNMDVPQAFHQALEAFWTGRDEKTHL